MKADWQSTPLVLAGILCLALALLHLEIILMGAPAYLYFGAGERMAALAQEGSWLPGLLTALVALLLGAFAAYAFAGVGIIRGLPWPRPMLLGICALFLLRGMAAVPQAAGLISGGEATGKDFSFSLVALLTGLLFAWGLANRWRLLRP
ncbi:MAG: hypothetical protein K9K66_03440 [Desulfarculaceae bacterium]|nr:hypothetical protein [Desulfarculaceae bacterium]MCF8071102.1 hypothetical protein [Desulfarculaceae bacterium]MCF8100690.1 hypothetical protein [Desulfarculaceae bacterium]MCF8118174.1 hypothetical protein [Desulfarculaceae bacterium]